METILNAPARLWRRRARLLVGSAVNVAGGCALFFNLLPGLI